MTDCDPVQLLCAIDACIKISRAAGTLITFESAIERVWDEKLGMNFIVRVAKSIDAKEKNDEKPRKTPPFMEPFEEGLFVKDFDDKHRLLLNKFSIVNRHVLIVTTKPKEQNSTMTRSTLQHVMDVVLALNGLAFHNHGEQSGASQPHFHVQVLPRHESESVPDAPLTDLIRNYDYLFGTATTIDRFPFRHLAIRFRPEEFTVENVEQHYKSMLDRLDLTPASSYNFLLTSEYMMIVPRRAKEYRDIGLNSIGFSGNVFVKDEEKRATLDKIGGPGELLLQLGYPISDLNQSRDS